MLTRLSAIAILIASSALGQEPKPVPAMQVLPLPGEQVSVEWNGKEISRYHYFTNTEGNGRPFLFPLVGPSGKSHIRMGHPRDPNGHSHHNGFWISHHDVNGVGFWNDASSSKGRIQHRRVSRFEDTDEEALIEVENTWWDLGNPGGRLLEEVRTMRFRPTKKDGEWLLIVDLLLTPGTGAVNSKERQPVTFGKTPFGITGVRLAKTIGVHDGGGRILNSEGGVNEAGVFWKQARWVDYSGPITKTESGGVTLFDHPINPSHPSHFHVRDDGWMGACLSYEEPRTIKADETLKLRYGLWIHGGVPNREQVEEQFQLFAKIGDVPAKSTKP